MLLMRTLIDKIKQMDIDKQKPAKSIGFDICCIIFC